MKEVVTMALTMQSVTSDYLACLLSSKHDAQDYPLPFRCQPTVAFTIAYSEYLDFLRYNDYKNLKLVTDDTTLQIYAEQDPNRLYSCYLQDVAFGIMKELYYATSNNGNATILLPLDSNVNSAVLADDLIEKSGDLGEQAAWFKSYLKSHDYKFTKEVKDGHNFKIYRLSLALLQQAQKWTAEADNLSILWE